MGRPIEYRPEDYSGHPQFRDLRWSEEWYTRPGASVRNGRLWEGECRRCGATVTASSGAFRTESASCACRGLRGGKEARSEAAVSAAVSEGLVRNDLLRRGYRVYAVVAASHHPDLSVLDADGGHFTVEVRTVRKDNSHARKPSDCCDVYAWVHRDGTIEYEPPLWQALLADDDALESANEPMTNTNEAEG
jgi:hypothetical protein